MTSRELMRLLKKLAKTDYPGLRWEKRRAGHVKITRVGHGGVVFTALTHSDRRGVKNMLADIRREFGGGPCDD